MSTKQLLTEKISLQPTQVERLKLIEYVQNNIENFVAAYKIPISKCYVENLNGRVYPHSLWEGVISRGEGEDTIGLLDHPNSDNG